MGTSVLSLDKTTGRAAFGHVTAELTKTETKLLWFLIEAAPKPCSSEELLQEVWRYVYTGCPGLVRQHVYNIRKKLGAHCILTEIGFGYYVECS